jgi:hypothetical protein
MNAEVKNNYFGALKHVYFRSGIITTSSLLRKVHTNDVYTLLKKCVPPAEERSVL